MNESYDPGTNLLVIALLAFYWQLLRIWHQPPPQGGNGKSSEEQPAAGPPLQLTPAALNQSPSCPSDAPDLVGPAPAISAGYPLAIIRAADEGFDEKAFLAGAAVVYELVVNAYAEEDAAVLDSLLDPQASHDLKNAIASRRARGEKLTFTFIGTNSMDIVRVWSEANLAEITVRFTGEAVVATYSAEGTLLDGDPEGVVEITDEWTFARCLGSRDPNWKLVAT